jgi:hypothetical protein
MPQSEKKRSIQYADQLGSQNNREMSVALKNDASKREQTLFNKQKGPVSAELLQAMILSYR